MNATASLARSITWAGSKQSYLTARLLADRDLADDCLRAYAYFRWADDIIDLAELTGAQRDAFIVRQQGLIERLYRGERPADLAPEEAMLADLIAHDRGTEGGLRSFIRNFMAVIAFDAARRGRAVSRRELDAYTETLATAVMDGLLYFIGNGHPTPRTPDRTLAVVGAHMTHMLRDLHEDLPNGILNAPAEDLQSGAFDLSDPGSESSRRWTRQQVARARACFRRGRRYIDSLDLLRLKLAGAWYCARFEHLLVVIERDGYRLRAEYPERHSPSAWLRMFGLGIVVAGRHIVGRLGRVCSRPGERSPLEAEGLRFPAK